MKYTELKEKQSEELNNFPMAFAFSKKQFEEGLEKLGIEKHEAVSIPGNGFIRKTDKQALLDLFEKHNQESKTALLDDCFMVDAIEYELANHEFCITYNPEPALDAVGVSLDDKRVLRLFKIARKNYLSSQE